MDSSAVSARRERIAIFCVALFLRAGFAALFFGSVDVINSAENSLALLGGKPVILPYFPLVNAFIWLGGVLSAHVSIPFPLALKLAPILCDSLMAVVLRDLAARVAGSKAYWIGLFYATSPVALMITSFHGQWDAVMLFFLLLAFAVREGSGDRRRRELFFGSLFALSVLAKPATLPFLLLFPRRRNETHTVWPAALGFCCVMSAAVVLCGMFGYSLPDILARIVVYGSKGVQVSGLPFAPLLAGLSLQRFRLFWVMPLMFVLAFAFHHRKLTALETILAFYLLSLGVMGYSPQYLLWPVPFLMATNRFRPASVYTAVTTLFLLLYYANPLASYLPYENMATFVPLRSFPYLAPPSTLTGPWLLPVVHVLGNIAVPAVAFTIGILIARKRFAERAKDVAPAGEGPQGKMLACYLAPPLLFGTAVFGLKLTIDEPEACRRLWVVWESLPARYALHFQTPFPHAIFVLDCEGNPAFNIIVLFALFALAWCLAAVWAGVRADRWSHPKPAP